MVEWYPHVLVSARCIPGGRPHAQRRRVLLPEDIALFEREFVEAEQAAYRETAKEDDEIAERMDAGRSALVAQGAARSGPTKSPMEDGMQHFHEFYRREMEAPSRTCRRRPHA
jgi:choline monooxygenase